VKRVTVQQNCHNGSANPPKDPEATVSKYGSSGLIHLFHWLRCYSPQTLLARSAEVSFLRPQRRACGRVFSMRRAHAILVILALLATPMALLARSDCDRSACDCMCDLVSHSLAANAHKAPKLCGQAASSLHQCAMNAKSHPPDFGLNTLMAPTAPLPVAAFAASIATAPVFAPDTLAAPSGCLAAPFEPPRS
jgi:hypothetical protein